MNGFFGKDWKTTSAGILAVVGGIMQIVFAIKNAQVNQEVLLGAISAILGGIGLIFAKDAAPEEPKP